ncbi:protein Skeletor, isoforms B/C-like [Apostichopus japonicus]|uniref:protein Skeletor, isoforms B/C-like n=1 Tax=Stichopus japonicus TaxID=307972 RepID=UPI003AB81750
MAILLSIVQLMLVALSSAAITNFGNLVGEFERDGTSHQISGSVFAVDQATLYIQGFNFDGESDCAVFYAGTSDDPSSGGDVIPVGDGMSDILGVYRNEDIMLSLSSGKITDYASFSILCEESKESFAKITIPGNFETPEPAHLGDFGFERRVHNVHADDVIILNPKQIQFVNLDYDGRGPKAFFWTGDGTPDSGDIKVPLPADNPDKILPKYSGATVTITLPDGLTVFDVDFIGIWCIAARQNFGHLLIKDSDRNNIPPLIEPATTPLPATNLENCKVLLTDRFHIAWTVDEGSNKITLEFRGILSLNEYLAFGISGSPTETSMVGSDVSVVWFDPSDSEPRAEDYHLNAYSQCIPNDGTGACPDQLQQGGEDNVLLVHGFQRNGLSVIRIERPLSASDDLDSQIITTGNVYVSWGIGFINPTGHVAKHDTPATGDVFVNFGSPSSTCPALKAIADVVPDPWIIEPLRPDCGDTLTAVIGPSGGQRGYQGIANQVGWGFAWFINGFLIPEIHVKRGCNYTFEVNGGDDETMTGTYHPFYITDVSDGGFLQKTAAERSRETKYSAVAEGPLCEYQGDSNPNDFENFDDYKATLTKECFSASSEPGTLVWQVAEDTPDLVYYQCYQHRFFGWKIHVSAAVNATPIRSLVLFFIAFSVMFLSL